MNCSEYLAAVNRGKPATSPDIPAISLISMRSEDNDEDMKRYGHLAFAFILFLASAFLCLADDGSFPSTINRALALDKAGKATEAIDLLEPLLQGGREPANQRDRGVARAVAAKAYQDAGDFDKAQRYYEDALAILSTTAGTIGDQASTLDNFGSLYKDKSQFAQAQSLREKALDLYKSKGDHAGSAVVFNNLTEMALEQNRLKEAEKYLASAVAEMKAAPTLPAEDQAALYTNKGTLSLLNGERGDARDSYRKAIELWTNAFGPDHYWVGLGYVLIAQSDAAFGYYDVAERDVQKGMQILQEALGRSSRNYALAQVVEARILKASGDTGRAHMEEVSAKRSLQVMQNQHCNGCTVNVEANR